MAKCNKKQCSENRDGKCALGLHPSWATCPQNNQKSVTTVQGTSYQAHVEAFQAYQALGCFDTGGLENSRR